MKISDLFKIIKIGKIINDGEFETVAKLSTANTKNTLVGIYNRKYVDFIKNDYISCVIAPESLLEEILNSKIKKGIWITNEDPKELFYIIHEYLSQINFYYTEFDSIIDSTSVIKPSSIISNKNVSIGKNCLIEENVVIKGNTKIGDNCIIRSGTIIGTPGYEVYKINGIKKVINHSGSVIMNNNIEIQANSCISRGLFPSRNTLIDDEVCIDNLVHIAHGVQIGKRTEIASNATIAGNVTIGQEVWIGPSATISNGIKIGDNAFITIGSVVISDVKNDQKVTGNFAIDHGEFMKQFIRSKKKSK